jgi:hypothetical protein
LIPRKEMSFFPGIDIFAHPFREKLGITEHRIFSSISLYEISTWLIYVYSTLIEHDAEVVIAPIKTVRLIS